MSEKNFQKKTLVVSIVKNALNAVSQVITGVANAALSILIMPRSNSLLLNADLTQVRF